MSAKRSRELLSLEWQYRLEPSRPLPILDLSQSIKSRYLTDRTVHKVNRFLGQHNVFFFYCYALSMLLSISIPMVSAETGRIAAVLAAVLCLPLGLGSLGALRYQVVRSLFYTDSFWFYIGVNSVTQVFTIIMYQDLRALRSVVDWINFANIVFIDARLRGIRAFANLSVLGLTNTMVLAIMTGLNHIDQMKGTSLWQYQTGGASHAHWISASIYVANGSGTLVVLIVKFLYRMRKSIRRQKTDTAVECAVYRCRLKLVNGSIRQVIVAAPKQSIRRPPWIQQMTFVREGVLFDARNIVIPIRLISRNAFAFPVLLFVYSNGCLSLLTLVLSIAGIENSIMNLKGTALSWLSLVSALLFCGFFVSFYQRALLKSVVSSFDFMFNSIQLTIVHFIGAAMRNWETRHCLCLVVSWVWIHWLLTLDSLTPIMKARLRFHIKYAIPVAVLFALGFILILVTIYSGDGQMIMSDLIWTGSVFGYRLEVHAMTFFMQRIESLLIWMLRLLLRMSTSSNQDAIILRGTLAYSNYMLNSARMGQNLQSAQRTQRSRRMSRKHQRVEPAPVNV